MKKEYLIEERPLKAMLVFAFPMILGNLFQQFYTMVNSVIVGRVLGENALAAVGASYSLTNVFISIAIGGGVGASVLTSRYFGARDYRRMKKSVYTALSAFFAVSVLLGGVGLLFSRQIMVALDARDNILSDATTYLDIYFIGLPFLFMYNVLRRCSTPSAGRRSRWRCSFSLPFLTSGWTCTWSASLRWGSRGRPGRR